MHTSADEPPTHTQPSILYDQNLCVMLHMTISQTVQRSAPAFMSPLLLRYVVTANMKSGLFCQKRVNKHGNTSSEGHSSISRDKCSESTVAFGLSHKMTEQTKVVADCNDLISTFFFPPSSQPTVKLLHIRKEGICGAIISHNCESTRKKKKNVLFPFLKRQILLVLTFNISGHGL